uniref:Uncharacterized protein n=1 Tax=Chaetoceros debilis TaxID=122233 RepID=A0A7S3Q0D4_9STRA|mmetsp:Transcript_22268/g.33981  ORF Transcript_22268/g.33981 Transcript_22268/m.33981 type:complete len:101 (+) Transcript_22268:106-408(+)
MWNDNPQKTNATAGSLPYHQQGYDNGGNRSDYQRWGALGGPTPTPVVNTSNASSGTRTGGNTISIECCCDHLKDFIVLAIVVAFIFFSGYMCYILISDYG